MYVLLDWYDEMCLDDQPVYNEECHGFHELTLCVCVGGAGEVLCVCVHVFCRRVGKGECIYSCVCGVGYIRV